MGFFGEIGALFGFGNLGGRGGGRGRGRGGRGRGPARRAHPGLHKGRRRHPGARRAAVEAKLASLEGPKCGLWCQWKKRRLAARLAAMPPMPAGPIAPASPLTPIEPPSPTTMNGYFGDWTWS